MKRTVLISLFVASSLFASIEFQNIDSNFTRLNPSQENGVILSYNSSIQDAKKAVVNVATKRTVSMGGMGGRNEFFNDPFFEQFFGFRFGIPEERKRELGSLGSGVIISQDGYIVTNNHVVEGADEVMITLFEGGKEYKAEVIGTDPQTDIAIIKIDEKNLNAIKFADSEKVLEGDIVFAIGNPFGVGGTITQGIISALNKSNIGLNQYENFIQTDASINPGNSGGALVDSRGALVGINSAILSRGGGNNGVGFAIPSNMVKDVAQKLIVDGKIERGYIGVLIADLTKEQKEVYKNKEGALIVGVEDDMPAYKAGLKRGDLVIKADGKEIKSSNDLKNLIGSLDPNKKIELEYERGGKITKTEVVLGNLNATKGIVSSTKSSLDGLDLKDLDDEIIKKFNLKGVSNGVLVTNVKENSKASKSGFLHGDIIIQVGDKEVKNISEFNVALSQNSGGKTLVWVLRRGVPQGLVIE
ncbi:MAG: Do family serine endopeptidase [Campylobacteraceae bacterium]|nr:Do family serine endopeptidase [Campylobacteraceae bacterium]